MFNVFPNSANRPTQGDFGLSLCIHFFSPQDPETHFCNFIVIITIIITIVCVVSNDSAPVCLRQ